MKSAPGAQLRVDEIFGRDQFTTDLWQILDSNSIRMEAERRIGKTSILHKMLAQPPKGWEVISLDLEEIHSAAEFAEKIASKVDERLTGWKKQGRRIGSVVSKLGGMQVSGLKFPEAKDRPTGYWKTLLTGAIEDLVEQQSEVGKRIVFLFDEMPWMLTAIASPDRDGEHVAMEVLDVLRAIRQSPATGRGFRMILCGSIGLHHVLGSLKSSGYKNQPVNDMRMIEVPPLDTPNGTELARRLIEGEGLASAPNAAAQIAEKTGGFPYYIHWVVSELTLRNKAATSDNIDVVMKTLLTDPQDPCHLRHFKERIQSYYPKEEKVVIALLDHAAAAAEPISQNSLINVAKLAGATDVNAVRDLIRLLSVDHYICRNVDGMYQFRHTLLLQWWRIEQGI